MEELSYQQYGVGADDRKTLIAGRGWGRLCAVYRVVDLGIGTLGREAQGDLSLEAIHLHIYGDTA